MTMDAGDFRQALGQFATGVCLVTVDDSELGPLATTVNSFSSVSLDPPLVLWSIQNSSDHLAVYTECQYFGISVLSSEQGAVSSQYAQRGGHGAQAEHFTAGPKGEPKLIDALAHFTCARIEAMKTSIERPHPDELILTRQRHHLIAAEVGRVHRIKPFKLRSTRR